MKVISMIKEKYGTDRIVMIGDGITDLEARPPASFFIGYGGNVVRERVKQEADYFVFSFEELLNLISRGE